MILNFISQAIANGVGLAFFVIALAWIIGIAMILGLAALITLVVKKVWHAGEIKQIQVTASEQYQINTAPIYNAQHGQWSPTGWIYDQDKQKWQPPDYLQAESNNRWKWDEEKRIWIDLEKPKVDPKERPSHPDIKIVRNGPSFEEWKNQHFKEIYEKLTEEAEKQQQGRSNKE